jgi:phosphotriesterase-related protein
VAPGQSKDVINLSSEQMYTSIKKDFFVGDANGTKCGIIGEIGSCWPIEQFERRSLEAAAAVQSEYPSIPVSIHPGRNKKAPFEIMRIFLEAGGNAAKTVMCHLDRTLLEDSDLLDFAELGTVLEFDLFGVETSYYQLSDEFDMPSDAIRINRLKHMVDEGLGERLVISHDIHTKQRLMRFGGHGYSHILQNVVPKMKMRGFSKKNIEDILINNPKKWLTV